LSKPDGLVPQRGSGKDGSLNEARWFYAPTGRKVIAQGKAKRRPGIGVPETTQALKGRNRRRVNPCVMFRPFRALANWGGGAPRSPVYPGWRFALPWAISLCPVGANDPVEKTRGLSPGFFIIPAIYRVIQPQRVPHRPWQVFLHANLGRFCWSLPLATILYDR
jgi:hypothetical protein